MKDCRFQAHGLDGDEKSNGVKVLALSYRATTSDPDSEQDSTMMPMSKSLSSFRINNQLIFPVSRLMFYILSGDRSGDIGSVCKEEE